MYLSWLADHVAPYDFRVNAAMLVLMQLIASVGLLVMLVRLFGARLGDPAPARALPVLHDLGPGRHLVGRRRSTSSRCRSRCSGGWRPTSSYLRTTPTSTPGGGAALGCLPGCCSTRRPAGHRRLRHRDAGLLHDGRRCAAALPRRGSATAAPPSSMPRPGVAYVVVLRELGPQLQPPAGRQRRLGEVITNMVFSGYLPAVLGGPLQWDNDRAVLPRLAQRRDRDRQRRHWSGWCSARSIGRRSRSPCAPGSCRRSSSAATSCWSSPAASRSSVP